MKQTSSIELPEKEAGHGARESVPPSGRGPAHEVVRGAFRGLSNPGYLQLHAETGVAPSARKADGAHGGSLCRGRACHADERRLRSGSARQHSVLRGIAHLCPHQRLSEEVVQGHRQPCGQGRLARGNRYTGSGRATRAGSRRPEHGRSKQPSVWNHRQALPGLGEDRGGLKAGR